MVDRKVTILGAGESGTGAALLAKAKGYDVFVSDYDKIKDNYKQELIAANIQFEEGKHSSDIILKSSLIIKSPGISEKAPIIQKAATAGIEFIDEIEFAAQYTSAKIIAITGTNGKTTTTLLTHHLLQQAGFNAGLAGNVGQSLAKQIIEDKHDYYVVEVSSFQLDGIVYFKPYIGILLNITPDHLDRYNNKISDYVKSKFQLISNMDAQEHFIYYADNELINNEVMRRSIRAEKHPLSLSKAGGIYAANGEMVFEDGFKVIQEDTPLKGDHNAINMMAAINAARIIGVGNAAITAGLKSFRNAPHRMEYVGTINNVAFINDSKATNVDAVQYALNSFEKPLVWIAGGTDKGNDYELMMGAVQERVKALVCLGKDNSRLRTAFQERIINFVETDNMHDAVRSAMHYAEADDVVLLSPACASFDLFNNYEDRGEQFRQAVMELKQKFETLK